MFTRTTTQLLESLREPGNDALWAEFDDRYRPVLLAFARAQGLDADAASEVAQVTLAQFSRDFGAGRYARERVRLSSWILAIARHRLIDLKRAHQRRRIERGQSAVDDASDERGLADAWESARQRVILERAFAVLRSEQRLGERTIQAFELCALRRVPPEAAAVECGMSVAETYVAKNRAIKRLREIVAHITMEFDDA